jgi:MinD-like ATPase involved in chromosome partitioning or flagellar assembly
MLIAARLFFFLPVHNGQGGVGKSAASGRFA